MEHTTNHLKRPHSQVTPPSRAQRIVKRQRKASARRSSLAIQSTCITAQINASELRECAKHGRGCSDGCHGGLGALKKLKDLLNYKDKLPEETRIDLEFFRSNLKTVSSLLKNIWEREDLDAECKDWMMEARDMSYAIEDDIDDFKHGLEHGGISFVQQSTNACTFKARKIQVQGLVQRYCEKWKDPETMSTNSRKLTVDKHESELVKMEEKKDELIKLLNEHKTICIIGFAGTGKTTLANMVYHSNRRERDI